MEPLTKRQRQVYDFIASYIAQKQYAPTLKEIGTAVGVRSLATVHKHLTALKAKRYIRRDWNRSRSMELVSPSIQVHEQWATLSNPDRFSDGKPHVCLWGDKGSAVENCEPDEKVCRVRVEVLEVLP